MTKEKQRTAVVFQGGGAYGALEYGAMKAIYAQGIKPDVVTGVSIGAINASVFAGSKEANPIKSLEKLWKRLTAVAMPGLPDWLHHLYTLPYNPGMYSINPQLFFSPVTATSYSETNLLKDTLNELINWEKLNDPTRSIKLAVTALNIKTGKLAVFRNYVDPARKEKDVDPPITAEHIIASGSLPPAFPMTKINGDFYWDGGLFSNTPLKPAFKALQAIDDGSNQQIKRNIIVLSLFPPLGEVPFNMSEVETRKTEIAFECKIDYDKELYNKIDKFREFAELVKSKLPNDKEIQEHEGFKRLIAYKPIHKLIEIRLDPPKGTFFQHSFMPGADFTGATIKDRVKLGEEIAIKELIKFS